MLARKRGEDILSLFVCLCQRERERKKEKEAEVVAQLAERLLPTPGVCMSAVQAESSANFILINSFAVSCTDKTKMRPGMVNLKMKDVI